MKRSSLSQRWKVSQIKVEDLLLRGDWNFLNYHLASLDHNDRVLVKQEYGRVFREAYQAEPAQQKKANAGRRAANLYILNR
jgi:hypothetical protein